MMPSVEGLGWIFDTVPYIYDKLRPGYTDELYGAIFKYVCIGKNSNVLEIGSGSGQATLPVLRTGCNLTAVECGENFSGILREKFGRYDNFSVITERFEDVQLHKDSYELIFAASSFHWVPEKTGYEKVYSVLKKGGAFARFANHPYPCKDDPALAEEINRIYDRYYYSWYNKKRKKFTEYTREEAEDTAYTAEQYGFTDIRCEMFYRERVFSAEEYISLLGTYSDHMAIEECIRNKFFSEIKKAINLHGGVLTISDTIDLQLARK